MLATAPSAFCSDASAELPVYKAKHISAVGGRGYRNCTAEIELLKCNY